MFSFQSSIFFFFFTVASTQLTELPFLRYGPCLSFFEDSAYSASVKQTSKALSEGEEDMGSDVLTDRN